MRICFLFILIISCFLDKEVFSQNAIPSSLTNIEHVSSRVQFIEAEEKFIIAQDPGNDPIIVFNEPVEWKYNNGKAVTLFDVDDEIKIKINIATSGNYYLTSRVRAGDYLGETKFWPNGYLFKLDNSGLSFSGELSTLSPIQDSFGKTYWGTMFSEQVYLEKGEHYLHVSAKRAFAAVDYFEIFSENPIENNIIEAEDNFTVINEANPSGYPVGKFADPIFDNQLGSALSLFDKGDIARLNFNTNSDGNYRIHIFLRAGFANDSLAYFKSGYKFKIDGLNQVLSGDNNSLTPFQFSFGGSYWGRMKSEILSLKTGSHTIDIESTLSFAAVDYFYIEKVNNSPLNITISNSTVVENNSLNALIGAFSTEDPDLGDSHTYELVNGIGSNDNSSFSIQGNKLLANLVFDFESKKILSIRIRSKDDKGGYFDKVFQIEVTDKNEAPNNIDLSKTEILEKQPVGTLIGSLSAADDDFNESHTFQLVDGALNNNLFSITQNQLKTGAVFNYSQQNSYNIRVRATDSKSATYEKDFVIKIIEKITPTTDIVLGNNLVKENAPIATIIGDITTVDENTNSSYSYNLVDGEGSSGNQFFQIDNNKLKTKAVLNFEKGSTFNIRV
ncbi:MAG: cadherin domain-containing protein, partial [Flammeovirgaceae bacterium]|nr:cadherin domain-containing protein [Flammeovirgaceae bacterium]